MEKIHLRKFFGEDYENKLLHLIIGQKTGTVRDSKFGKSILPIISVDYFSTSFSQKILSHITTFYQKYKSIPFYDEIKGMVNTSSEKEHDKRELLLFLKEIFYIEVGEEKSYVQDSANDFFKQQRLLAAAEKIREIGMSGAVDRYAECERLVKDALRENDLEENHYVTEEVTDGDFLEEHETYIKLGWGEGVESYLAEGRGLRVGKCHGIFAPSGGGKTTGSIVTLSNAFLAGHDVVQILFEDTLDDIKKFQKAHWSGLSKNHINKQNKDIIKFESNEKIIKARKSGGNWIVKRFRSNRTTMDDIEQYLLKLKEMGYNPKLVTLDYLECIESLKKYKESWMGELDIIRDFDYLASKEYMDFCGIVFCQGNRGAQIAEVLDERHLGGNFKKYQPCHTFFAVAPISKLGVNDKANISLLKNRSGAARILFKEGTWNRGTVKVNFGVDTVAGGINEFLKAE